jgi:hypothetical protein
MKKRIFFYSTLAGLCFFSLSDTSAATLSVPGGYATIQAAVTAAADGDIIEIKGGEYSSGIIATISQDNLTLRGIDGMAHLNADSISISNKKAIFVTTGDNITIDNIAFSNARVPDSNGAGIRHEGGLLTIRNCYFHDNEDGILTSNQGSSGELVVENSEFAHNGLGSAGYTHNIYVGHIGKFIFRYSYSHHATHGHNIKSRAAENHILYSRIMDEDTGNASYQIDLPNGGLSYIIGNSLHQGTHAENSTMISYAAEGATNPVQEVYLSGNTLVNDRSVGYGIRLSGSPVGVIRNNIFDNLTDINGSPTIFEGNLTGKNIGFVNRTGFDYHLQSTSAARNNGVEPGSANGMSLKPVQEYVHPLQSSVRRDDGNIDTGAFEYSASVPPPSLQPTIVPSNFLLLQEP